MTGRHSKQAVDSQTPDRLICLVDYNRQCWSLNGLNWLGPGWLTHEWLGAYVAGRTAAEALGYLATRPSVEAPR